MPDQTRKCYIVTFDVASGVTHGKLIALLKGYGSFCPITQTCWAILSGQTAKQVRDNLAQELEANDRLFVVRSGVEAAWRNSYGPKNSEWLKKNL